MTKAVAPIQVLIVQSAETQLFGVQIQIRSSADKLLLDLTTPIEGAAMLSRHLRDLCELRGGDREPETLQFTQVGSQEKIAVRRWWRLIYFEKSRSRVEISLADAELLAAEIDARIDSVLVQSEWQFIEA
jgi:hypothetical protein